MRQLTSQEIAKIKLLTENSVEVSLIEPTANGLSKSIMDATSPVRSYFMTNHVHDYANQKQGQDHKIFINSLFVGEKELIKSNASLYRPPTKKGDPRIWFSGLTKYSAAYDILGLTYFNETLYVINLTQLDIDSLLAMKDNNPLKELINQIRKESNEVAEELLKLLYRIAGRGPIPSAGIGDTGVGSTLERLLNIKTNSSKKPDYKGIELKSFRDKRANRKTLFAQVPDWNLSNFKSSADILDAFGYPRGIDFKLYCTVSTLVANSQGLQLKLDKSGRLIEYSTVREIGDVALWVLEVLHKRLLEKHNETFWIAADAVTIDGKEHFIYKKVEHTKKPIATQFDILIDQGIITLDHLIKRNVLGRVIEKGPLFKIKPKSLNLLFPPSKLYQLSNNLNNG